MVGACSGGWAVKGKGAGRLVAYEFRNGPDVVGCGPAAASEDVDEPFVGKRLQLCGHGFRALIVLAHLVGKAGIGMR